MTAIEITAFWKEDGPLTKQIWLTQDGQVKSDTKDCWMARGEASRLPVRDIDELGNFISQMKFDQAIALGALRPGLPNKVHIVTKRELNGQPNTIARIGSEITFQHGRPAYGLLDHDTKGIPDNVKERITQFGGFWPALTAVLPALEKTTHLLRSSTSAGLYRTDTNENLPGSGGQHVYIEVVDGTDIVRFLQTLHDRCWRAGLGWMMIGGAGQFLDRSIVDRTVGLSERLVFEGPPV